MTHITPEAKQESDTLEIVAWIREWDGDDSDLGNMVAEPVIDGDTTPPSDGLEWFPCVLKQAADERLADLERQLSAVTAERDKYKHTANDNFTMYKLLLDEKVALKAERDALKVDAENCKPLTAWMDNVIAARLGKVALAAEARTDGMAESVDFGLRLRRLLEESGFEVRVAAIDAARAK